MGEDNMSPEVLRNCSRLRHQVYQKPSSLASYVLVVFLLRTVHTVVSYNSRSTSWDFR